MSGPKAAQVVEEDLALIEIQAVTEVGALRTERKHSKSKRKSSISASKSMAPHRNPVLGGPKA